MMKKVISLVFGLLIGLADLVAENSVCEPIDTESLAEAEVSAVPCAQTANPISRPNTKDITFFIIIHPPNLMFYRVFHFTDNFQRI